MIHMAWVSVTPTNSKWTSSTSPTSPNGMLCDIQHVELRQFYSLCHTGYPLPFTLLTLYPCLSSCRSVLITCSNNSVDLAQYGRDKGEHGVTGEASGDDYQGPWWQWSVDEGGRAGPPIHSDNSDTYTVGMAIDYTSQEVVPISKCRDTVP